MMHEQPSVSVIVVTYNSERWIRACLDALLQQETSRKYEIVIHDNGSTDETRNIVETSYPTVRFVQGMNVGFGAGNNRAVAHARGALLAFVNPDTKAERNWLEGLAASTKPGVITTSRIVLLQDPTVINTCGNDLHFTGYGFARGFGEPRQAHATLCRVPGISGAAFAMLREDYEAIGGFDEDFFLYMEDTELSWRANRAGMQILLVPESVVQHSYTLTINPSKLYHVQRGRIMILRKHLSGRDWIKFLPSLVVASAVGWVAASKFGWAGMRKMLLASLHGWTARLKRYETLPRTRPRDFATRELPLALFVRSKLAMLLGQVMNGIFKGNTLRWTRQGGGTRE